MKIIPVLFIILGIVMLLRKRKLKQLDFICAAIFCLCGYSAIIYGSVCILLDLGLREYFIASGIAYTYYWSFIAGMVFGWAILLILVEVKIGKRKKLKDTEIIDGLVRRKRHRIIALLISIVAGLCFLVYGFLKTAEWWQSEPDQYKTGLHVVFQAQFNNSNKTNQPVRSHLLEKTASVIRKRMKRFGVKEPRVQVKQPDNILVEFPGNRTPRELVKIVSKPEIELRVCFLADNMTFRRIINEIDDIYRVKDRIYPYSGQTRSEVNSTNYKIMEADIKYFRTVLNDPRVRKCIPENYEIVLGRPMPYAYDEQVYRDFALVTKKAVLNETDVKDAKEIFAEKANDKRIVFKLSKSGMEHLRNVSRECEMLYNESNVVSQLAIIIDNVIYSTSTITTHIDSNPTIQGSLSTRRLADLALNLRTGSLPVNLRITAQNSL